MDPISPSAGLFRWGVSGELEIPTQYQLVNLGLHTGIGATLVVEKNQQKKIFLFFLLIIQWE